MTHQELNALEDDEILAWKAYKAACDKASLLQKIWLERDDQLREARHQLYDEEMKQRKNQNQKDI